MHLLKTIAQFINAKLISSDDSLIIHRINSLEDSEPGDITFLSKDQYYKQCLNTKASAIILNPASYEKLKDQRQDLSYLIVDNAYLAFAQILNLFDQSPKPERIISPKAVIHETVQLGKEVGVYPGVYIGKNVKIGDQTLIYPNCTIEDNVIIGNSCIIYANVVIRYNTEIADRVIIHSGTVVGSDGFGFAPDEQFQFHKIPQIGKVIIEDDVEIGSNVSIDRAAFHETRICKGVKLDNLIQVAHNVRIGEHTVIAAQTGISGSTKIGSHNMFGGQVGFAGHLTTGDRVMIGAQSGIHKNIPDDEKVFGTPARPINQTMRIEAIISRLPEYIKLLKTIAKQLNIKLEK